MPLFYEMVYKTFAFKYGIDINFKETHTYIFRLIVIKGYITSSVFQSARHLRFILTKNGLEMDNKSLKEMYLYLSHLGMDCIF